LIAKSFIKDLSGLSNYCW